MAKLFASEAGVENSLEAMRIFGGYSYSVGLRRRALLPRRAADVHRRGHQRDAAHHHRQAADREESGVSPRPAARGHPGADVRELRRRAVRLDVSRRPGRRGRSRSRTANRAATPRAPWARISSASRRQPLLPDVQPQQEERHAEPEARRRARRRSERSCATADVVLNNLRGDQPEKLGLDYATLGPVNPKIALRAPLGLRPRQRAQGLAGLRLPDAGRSRLPAPHRRTGHAARADGPVDHRLHDRHHDGRRAALVADRRDENRPGPRHRLSACSTWRCTSSPIPAPGT